MIQVSKISAIKSVGSYEYNGAVINVIEITGSKKLKGVCKLQDGTEFNFTNGASNLLYRIEHAGKCKPRAEAGKETSANIPARVDNSQAHGQHKVVAVSDNKLARQHRAVMQVLSTINKLFGYQDTVNTAIQASWYEYSREQQTIAKRLRLESEARAKAKAEAEAKAKADAEAKAEAARIEAQRQMVELAAKNAGISIEEAEKNLRALGMIK